MQIPNRRVHKMIEDLEEVAELLKGVDYASATKLTGMATYLKGNFKSRPAGEASGRAH